MSRPATPPHEWRPAADPLSDNGSGRSGSSVGRRAEPGIGDRPVPGGRDHGTVRPPADAPPGAPQGDRLPRPPRRRRLGTATVALLLVIGGAAAAGTLALRIDDRTPVVVARAPIQAGQRIRAADLATVPMAAEGIAAIRAEDAEKVIGRYAVQDITRGRLLDAAMVTDTGLLAPGRAAVGVRLAAGHAPADGFRAGDRVLLVRAVNGAATVLSDNGIVGAVREADPGTFGEATEPVITVLVDTGDAPAVAAAAAADQIVVVAAGAR